MAKKHDSKASSTASGARVVGGVGVNRGAIGQAGRFSGERNANRYTLAGRTTAAGRNLVNANRTATRMLQVGAKTKSLPMAARGLGRITRLETLRESSGRMIAGFKAESALSSRRFVTAGALSSELLRRGQSTKSLPQLTDSQIRGGGDAIAREKAAEKLAEDTARFERNFERVFGDQVKDDKQAGEPAQTGKASQGDKIMEGGSVGAVVEKSLRKTAGIVAAAGADGTVKSQGSAADREAVARAVRIAGKTSKSSGEAIDTTGFDKASKEAVSAGKAAIEQAKLRREPKTKTSGQAIDTTGFNEFLKQDLSSAQAALAELELRIDPGTKTSGEAIDTTGFSESARNPLSLGEANLEQLKLRLEGNKKKAGPEIDTSGFKQVGKTSVTSGAANLAQLKLKLQGGSKSVGNGSLPAALRASGRVVRGRVGLGAEFALPKGGGIAA